MAVSAVLPGDTAWYSRRGLLLALALYVAVAVLLAAPQAHLFGDFIIGPPEDNLYYFWNFWWAERVLTEPGLTLTATTAIYYPQGSRLVCNDYSFYNLAVAMLLRRFLPRPWVYNLVVLHCLVFAGLGAYLLICYLLRNRYAALLGGIIYGFNPAQLASAQHHLNLIAIQFMPLFMLFYLRALRHGRARDLMLAGMFFLLNALCSWYYLLALLIFVVLGYGYLVLRRRQLLLWPVVARTVPVVTIPCVLLAPWLVALVEAGVRHPEISRATHDVLVLDAAALVLPYPHHWLSGPAWLDVVNRRLTGNAWESTVYWGAAVLVLLLSARVFWLPAYRKFVLGLAACTVLAMGSHLHVGGYVTPLPLPYAVLKSVPLFNLARAPVRLKPLVYLFLAILAAVALHELWQRRQRAWRIAAVALALLIVAEYCVPRREVTLIEALPVYGMLPAGGEAYGILDLPGGDARYSLLAMMYQTFHRQPIVEGHNARKLGTALRDYLELADLPRQHRQLAEHRVRYIVLHKDWLAEHRSRDPLPSVPAYRAEYPAVYEDGTTLLLQVY